MNEQKPEQKMHEAPLRIEPGIILATIDDNGARVCYSTVGCVEVSRGQGTEFIRFELSSVAHGLEIVRWSTGEEAGYLYCGVQGNFTPLKGYEY